MPQGMNVAPTRPIGAPDVIWGQPGTGGYLTEWSETVPDLVFPESIRTYGRMRRDPKATAVLSAYFLPILRCNWAVDPEGINRAEAADLVAADLGLPILGQKGHPKDSPIRGFRWKEHVRLALLSLVYGLMPFERWFSTAGGRTRLAGIQERLPHTITGLDIDETTGAMRSVEQSTQLQPIPANRLTWYVNGREGANWAGVSLLRPCYTPWVLKHEVMRVHATSHRRWGMGVPVVHAPAGATPAQVEEARRLAAGMRAGDQAGAGMPAGFNFELAGLTGSTPDAIGFLNFLNQEIAGSALAKVIELGTTSEGSRALGDTFLDLFLLALQAGADTIGDTATYGDPAMPGLSRALVDYNWGEDEPCPRIVATDVGDRHEITAAAIQQLLASGAITPDDGLEAFLREAWSLPKRTTPRPTVPPPPPARPAGPPTPGGTTGGGGGAQPGGGGGPGLPPPSPPRQPPAPAAAWEEKDHPRVGHGEHGGEFTRKPGGGGFTGNTYQGDPLTPGQQTDRGLVVAADRDREHLVLFDPAAGSFTSYAYDPAMPAATIPGVVKAAARLNAGDPLGDAGADPALRAGIAEWIGTGTEPGQGHPLAAEAFRQAVRAAPPDAPTLWRGMNQAGAAMKNADREFTALHAARPGFRFHTGMASWTTGKDVATQFARTSGGGQGNQIIMRLKDGSASLRIDQYTGTLEWQHEWVSRGDYEVTGRSAGPDGTVILDVVQR